MDLNLADTLLELDSEDIADIYQMVSEWEFNFGSLEVRSDCLGDQRAISYSILDGPGI